MAINFIDVKLIGVDDYSGETATLSTLATKSNYVSSDLATASLNLTPNLEGDTVEYITGVKIKSNSNIMTGELYLNPKLYPEIATDLTYFDFLTPLRRKYLYLYSADYKIYFSGLTNTAVRINTTGLNYEATANGLIKSWKLAFEFGSYL